MFGVLVLAALVVMLGLMMMMRGSVVMSGGSVMMFLRGMLCHPDALHVQWNSAPIVASAFGSYRGAKSARNFDNVELPALFAIIAN
jgi:hypothetical protein